MPVVTGVVVVVVLPSTLVAGLLSTTWPQLPVLQLLAVPQVLVVVQLPSLQPRTRRPRRPPASASTVSIPATAKASAKTFQDFMTYSNLFNKVLIKRGQQGLLPQSWAGYLINCEWLVNEERCEVFNDCIE